MLRKSVFNLGSQLVNFVVSFGDRILLVGLLIRSWGADAYSDWAALLAAAGLFGLAELGFQIQYGNRLSLANARGDSISYARTLGVGLFYYASLAAVLAVVLAIFLISFNPVQIFNLRHLRGMPSALTFGFLGATSIVHIGRAGLSQIYRSRGEFHRGILIDTGVSTVTIGAAVLSALAGASPAMLALVYLAAEILVGWGGMGTDIARRYADVRFRLCLPKGAELTDLGRTLFSYALIQGLPTAWVSVPVLIVSALSLGGLGLVSFVVQRTLVNFCRTLSTMLSVAVGIELATLTHIGAQAQVAQGVKTLALLNATLAGSAVAGLAFFGPAVITIWTGRSDLASLPLLAAFVLPGVMVAASTPLSMLCMYAGRPHPSSLALGVQVIVGISIAFVGGAKFGVIGVAFGVALGEIIGSGIVLPLLAARSFNIVYVPLFLKCLLASGMAGLWGISIAWVFLPFGGDTNVWQLAATLLMWAIVGVLPTLFLVVPRETRLRLIAVIRGLLAKSHKK